MKTLAIVIGCILVAAVVGMVLCWFFFPNLFETYEVEE